VAEASSTTTIEDLSVCNTNNTAQVPRAIPRLGTCLHFQGRAVGESGSVYFQDQCNDAAVGPWRRYNHTKYGVSAGLAGTLPIQDESRLLC
jgi:hypothetical protein